MAKTPQTNATTPPQTRTTAPRTTGKPGGNAAAAKPAAVQQAAATTAAAANPGNLPAVRDAKNSPQALANVSRQIVPFDVADWAIMQGGGDDGDGVSIMDAMHENLGNAQMRAFDLERIRVPAGGGLAWTVTDEMTGNPKAETEIVGIPMFWKDQKAFWARGLDEAGAVKGPPDCSSTNCAEGFGDPGNMADGTKRAKVAPSKQSYLCATCANNKFKSAKGGTGLGKACKDVRLLFVVRASDLLPILIPIPPTSIPVVQQFLMKLTGRKIMYWSAVCKFTLSQAQNATQTTYSKVGIQLVGVLPPEQRKMAREFNNGLKAMMGEAPLLIQSNDLTGANEPIDGTIVDGSEDRLADNIDAGADNIIDNVGQGGNVDPDTGELIEGADDGTPGDASGDTPEGDASDVDAV